MKKINILLIVLLFLPAYIFAQRVNSNTVTTQNTTVLNANGTVTLHTDVSLRNLDLSTQEMIYLVPTLVSADSMYTLEFDPIVIAAPTRYKALNRSLDFDNIHFDRQPKMIMRYRSGRDLMFPLNLSFAYQPWMDNSRLIFAEDLSGCGCDKLSSDQYTVINPVLPIQFVPRYEVSYITPPIEPVKQRSETYSAHINFELNRYQILRNFKNNAQVLDEVGRIINEIRNDANLSVKEFIVTGYASPEGGEQHNMNLSKNRAESFVRYLIDNYRISPTDIKTEWKGEDWAGLRRAVENSSMSYRADVLDILDNTPNVATRKNRLKQLAGGVPYRSMLNELYPPLRRNDYTITYVSRAFTVDEARLIIKTKPQHLSQNEMYMVANSYPRNSREFREIFDVISRYYPDDEVAVMNSLSYQIENGDGQATIARLERINKPEAWNNLGIVYYNLKDYEKAGMYFRRAAGAGYQPAVNNVAQFDRFMQSQAPIVY